MAYKKFIKRGGKTFGPYYYESYRNEKGKVSRRYLGTEDPDKGKKGVVPTLNKIKNFVGAGLWSPVSGNKKLFFVPVVLAVVFFGIVFLASVNSDFSSNSIVSGSEGLIKSFVGLTGFAVDDVDDEQNDGEQMTNDEVDDGGQMTEDGGEELDVSDEELNDEEIIQQDEQDEQDDGEQMIDDEIDDKMDDVEQMTEDGVVENESVDGEVVSGELLVENVSEIINGLGENESRDYTDLNESVDGEVVSGELLVENVSEIVNETVENGTIEQDEQDLNDLINDSIWDVVDNESVVVENISVEFNETILNETILNETLINESVEEFVLNVTNISVLQYKAVAGRPVKWLKKINVNESKNLSIEIPVGSNNISVLTDEEVDEAEREIEEYEDVVDATNRKDIVSGVLTGNVVSDIGDSKGLLTRFWNWIFNFRISGNVVLEDDLKSEGSVVELENVTVVDVAKVVNETNASKVGVEYYTPAPVVVETNISKGKRIVVSADDVYNYTEVLAYTLVEGNVSMNSSKLKLYWMASYEDALEMGFVEGAEVLGDEVLGVSNESEEGNIEQDDGGQMMEAGVGEKGTIQQDEQDEQDLNESVGGEVVSGELLVENVSEIVNEMGKNESQINADEQDLNEMIIEEVNENIEEVEEENIEQDKKDKKDKGNSGKKNRKSFLTGMVVGSEELVVGSNETGDDEVLGVSNDSVGERYYRIEVDYVGHDFDGDGFVDYVEWIVPHLSNQTYELVIEILNIQSYPTVGGNWTVGFNTTGVGNLSVSPFNGTTYGFENNGSVVDLEFLDLRCGDEVVEPYVLINGTMVSYDVYLKKQRIEEIRRELDG